MFTSGQNTYGQPIGKTIEKPLRFTTQSHRNKDSAIRFHLPIVNQAKADLRQAHWARVPHLKFSFWRFFIFWLYYMRLL